MNLAMKSIRRAFTLVELLVVISIFVLLLALAVPAFSSMLYSSEQALAEQSLRVALNTARNVAMSAPAGQDSAAVFLYDSVSHKTTVMVCTKAGELSDIPPPTSQAPPVPVTREVFAAAPGVEPVQLSAGWTIRGYAAANTIDDDWYGDGTYSTNAIRRQGNWLFPETSFYDDDMDNDGPSRQTFMVRFEGSTGLVKLSDVNTVLVLSPSESISFRTNWPPVPAPPTPSPVPPWDSLSNNPLNPTHETDPVRFVKRIVTWPSYTTLTPGSPGAITLATKRRILGDLATDSILTKPVGQLALCKESRLASGIGAKLDPATGCLYQNLTNPVFVTINGSAFNDNDIDRMNQWIEGRLVNASNDPVDSDCRVFTLQRYLGWLQEVTGSRNGLGVGS